MGWFSSSSSRHRSSSRPGYARSWAGSSYSSSRHHSSTSRYKRSPRDSYMQHLYHKFRHLLRNLWAYARRHPYKIFFMVIMPLVSGGVLHKLARQFGVNLPEMGGQSRGSFSGGGYYGSEGYSGGSGGGDSGGGLQSLATGIGNLAGLAKMAQAFM